MRPVQVVAEAESLLTVQVVAEAESLLTAQVVSGSLTKQQCVLLFHV